MAKSNQKHPPRPLVLSKNEYDSILSHLNRDEKKLEVAEQEEQYREYLRLTSAAMTQNWKNSIVNKTIQKGAERQKKKEDAIEKDEQYAKHLAAIDRERRQEIIDKAEKLIQKLKVGPRQLESAALLSQVLKEREVQFEFKKSQQERERKVKRQQEWEILSQAKQWVEKTAERQKVDKKRFDQYKQDIYELMCLQKQRQEDESKRRIEEEQTINERNSEEWRKANERLKQRESQKKVEFRENQIEAIKAKMDKFMREEIQDEIEREMIENYVKGKEQQIQAKRIKQKELQDLAEVKRAEIAKQFEALEKEVLAKQWYDTTRGGVDVTIVEKRDKERAEVKKRIKAMIQQSYEEAMEQEKKNRDAFIEEREKDWLQHVKNNAVSLEFKTRKVEESKKNAKEIRMALDSQVKEKQEAIRMELEEDKKRMEGNLVEHIADDKVFYAYANDLLKDAKKKERSVRPLLQAVDEYQRNNLLKYKEKDNRDFRFSKVPIKDDKPRRIIPLPEDLIEKYRFDELNELNPYKKPIV